VGWSHGEPFSTRGKHNLPKVQSSGGSATCHAIPQGSQEINYLAREEQPRAVSLLRRSAPRNDGYWFLDNESRPRVRMALRITSPKGTGAEGFTPLALIKSL
jgi:hypothetical protein